MNLIKGFLIGAITMGAYGATYAGDYPQGPAQDDTKDQGQLLDDKKDQGQLLDDKKDQGQLLDDKKDQGQQGQQLQDGFDGVKGVIVQVPVDQGGQEIPQQAKMRVVNGDQDATQDVENVFEQATEVDPTTENIDLVRRGWGWGRGFGYGRGYGHRHGHYRHGYGYGHGYYPRYYGPRGYRYFNYPYYYPRYPYNYYYYPYGGYYPYGYYY